jgi:predicted kinase
MLVSQERTAWFEICWKQDPNSSNERRHQINQVKVVHVCVWAKQRSSSFKTYNPRFEGLFRNPRLGTIPQVEMATMDATEAAPLDRVRHTVHVVCGMPGSGKTTFGSNLARDLKAALLDIDTCTEKMVQVGMRLSGHDPADRDSKFFKSNYRDPIYETLFAVAAENVKHIDVVIIGPFTKEVRDASWHASLTATFNSHVMIYNVYCDPSIRKTRLEVRGNPRDASKLQDWESHCKYYDDLPSPRSEHVWVNTS